jgi:site-specific recombinase XerD
VTGTRPRSFDAYLARRGRAPRTRDKYGFFLQRYERWAGDRDPGSISAREIELVYLGDYCRTFEDKNGHPPSANTLRHHIAALKSYYSFLERFDIGLTRAPLGHGEINRFVRRPLRAKASSPVTARSAPRS